MRHPIPIIFFSKFGKVRGGGVHKHKNKKSGLKYVWASGPMSIKSLNTNPQMFSTVLLWIMVAFTL